MSIDSEIREVELSLGYIALVDAEDYDSVARYRWHAVVKGNTIYAARNESGRRIYMHRQLIGATPTGIEVDHIRHPGTDNRRSNLRLATKSQNQANSIPRKNNTSGFKGVSWNKQKRKWRAYIKLNYRQRFLGYFNCPKLAYAAYCKAAESIFGEFARTA